MCIRDRSQTVQCKETICREVEGLLERGVFERVKKKDVPPNANILTTRMVLAVKDIGTANEKYKARVAAHGHKDSDKDNRVHNSPTILPVSLRILLTSAAIKRFRI